MTTGSEAAIYWRCRRGTRELDVLLMSYFDKDFGYASPAEREAFSQLLDLSDPELWLHITGFKKPLDPTQDSLLEKIRNHLSV